MEKDETFLKTRNKAIAFYLPGSTLQLVPRIPHVVLGGEERDGALVVVVAQKGFQAWKGDTVSVSAESKCASVFYFVVLNFNLNSFFFFKVLLEKQTNKTQHISFHFLGKYVTPYPAEPLY